MTEPAPSSSPPPPASPPTRAAQFWALMRRLGPVGPVAVISMTLPGVMGLLLVGGAVYWERPLTQFAHDQWAAALVGYVVGFALLAGFPILPTYSVTFLGGYIFKFYWGSAAALAGYTGAALVSYVFLHLLSGDRVQALIDEHPKWRAVRDELLARSAWRTLWIVALLRLPPNLPFAVVNLVIVTARIRLGTYFLGTMLGVVPRTLAVAFIADSASRIDDIKSSAGWLTIAGIAVTVAVLAVLTHIAHRAIRRFADRNGPAFGVEPVPPDPSKD